MQIAKNRLKNDRKEKAEVRGGTFKRLETCCKPKVQQYDSRDTIRARNLRFRLQAQRPRYVKESHVRNGKINVHSSSSRIPIITRSASAFSLETFVRIRCESRQAHTFTASPVCLIEFSSTQVSNGSSCSTDTVQP